MDTWYMLVTGHFITWLTSPLKGTAGHLQNSAGEPAEGSENHLYGTGRIGHGKGLHRGEPFSAVWFFPTLAGYISLCFSLYLA